MIVLTQVIHTIPRVKNSPTSSDGQVVLMGLSGQASCYSCRIKVSF
ncbi:MAG: hypothetical protein M3Z01_04720 [Thermoproteota archaeon]|nr:hypothetical protein [Thermoproteota archaeon]